MNRRNFLQASAAVVVGSTVTGAVGKAQDTEQPGTPEDAIAWGPDWMPAIKSALGIEGEVETLILSFHTSEFAEAIILRSNSHDILRLSLNGIVKIKEALGLSHYAQHLSVTIPSDSWVFFSYQFAPKSVPVATLIDVLKADA